jgi:hypothetical protein
MPDLQAAGITNHATLPATFLIFLSFRPSFPFCPPARRGSNIIGDSAAAGFREIDVSAGGARLFRRFFILFFVKAANLNWIDHRTTRRAIECMFLYHTFINTIIPNRARGVLTSCPSRDIDISIHDVYFSVSQSFLLSAAIVVPTKPSFSNLLLFLFIPPIVPFFFYYTSNIASANSRMATP